MPDPKLLVMVADPDPFIRSMICRFITDAGYQVAEACEGYEALDSARKLLPAILFADLMLPKLDGIALCRLLKNDPATENIVSVVLLSVLTQEQKAKESGAKAFVKKPLEKKRILNVLEQLIGAPN